MNIDPTIDAIVREIRCIFAEQTEVYAVFGFGSYFRREQPYRDIDVLVVLKPDRDQILPTFCRVKSDLEQMGKRMAVSLDLTFLKFEEFADRPLRDMDSLVDIFRDQSLETRLT